MSIWIKVPGPGQFRGEGEWKEVGVDIECTDAELLLLKETNYLPFQETDRRPLDEVFKKPGVNE